MPKTAYIEKRFNRSSVKLIEQANEIIDEYMADDLRLTLRQLYYQFVARGLIANKQKEYKRLGSVIGDARMAGLVDWNAIEDRTRNLSGNTHWRDPGHIMQAVTHSFHMDHWAGQKYHVEVWIEKEALTGVIALICNDLDVDFFACKGYVSLSEMWSAARRLDLYDKSVIIHLGDHDPSGLDMTRDIRDRQLNFEVFDVKVERIALNMDQVEEYKPPPNPAKLTDSRCQGYIKKHGYESWELDALEPRILRALIRETVLKYRDNELYQQVLDQEKEYKNILEKVERDWYTL